MRKYSTPFVVRFICALSLFVCAAIMLGLSSDVEHGIRHAGLSTSWLPYIVFVGSFTLIFETFFFLIRLIATKSAGAWIMVDICWSVLMYFMWLAAAIVVSDKIVACNGLGNQSAGCDKLRAVTAFAWLGWILWWVVLGLLFYVGIGESNAGNKGVWRRALPSGQTDYHDEALATNGVPATGEKLPRGPNEAPLGANGTTGFPTDNTLAAGDPAPGTVMTERPTV